jgi:hypothetical protein
MMYQHAPQKLNIANSESFKKSPSTLVLSSRFNHFLLRYKAYHKRSPSKPRGSTRCTTCFNILKTLHSVNTVYLGVTCGSHNNERLSSPKY